MTSMLSRSLPFLAALLLAACDRTASLETSATPEATSFSSPAGTVSFSPSRPDVLPLYRCPHVAAIPPDAAPLDPEAAPWTAAPVVDRFFLCDATTPAERPTTARMVWDDQAIHVLFVCDDPHVWSRFTEDQQPLFKEEVVEVFLNPAGEGREYFEFEVSPLNKRFAAVIRNNGEIPPRFSPGRRLDPAGMTTRVHVDGTVNDSSDTDRRWTVYVCIPFEYLDQPTPQPGDVWRANLYRIDRDDPRDAPDEFSCWSPTHNPTPNFHISRYFGGLEFTGSD